MVKRTRMARALNLKGTVWRFVFSGYMYGNAHQFLYDRIRNLVVLLILFLFSKISLFEVN